LAFTALGRGWYILKDYLFHVDAHVVYPCASDLLKARLTVEILPDLDSVASVSAQLDSLTVLTHQIIPATIIHRHYRRRRTREPPTERDQHQLLAATFLLAHT
jgi:hypothetical protein